jgi:hypothetical protein
LVSGDDDFEASPITATIIAATAAMIAAVAVGLRYQASAGILSMRISLQRHLSATYQFQLPKGDFIPLIGTIVRGKNRPINGVS